MTVEKNIIAKTVKSIHTNIQRNHQGNHTQIFNAHDYSPSTQTSSRCLEFSLKINYRKKKGNRMGKKMSNRIINRSEAMEIEQFENWAATRQSKSHESKIKMNGVEGDREKTIVSLQPRI